MGNGGHEPEIMAGLARVGHAALVAAPLLVAGCGCGLVITANQTLTLHEITRANAPGWPPGFTRPAGASARPVSTALASALFFGGLATTGGDYHAAVGRGLASPAVLVGVASLIGTADILWPSRGAPEDGSKESSDLGFPAPFWEFLDTSLKFPHHKKIIPVPSLREFREKAEHFRGFVECHQRQKIRKE